MIAVRNGYGASGTRVPAPQNLGERHPHGSGFFGTRCLEVGAAICCDLLTGPVLDLVGGPDILELSGTRNSESVGDPGLGSFKEPGLWRFFGTRFIGGCEELDVATF